MTTGEVEGGERFELNGQTWIVCQVFCSPGSADALVGGGLPVNVEVALVDEVRAQRPEAFDAGNLSFCIRCPSYRSFEFDEWTVTLDMIRAKLVGNGSV